MYRGYRWMLGVAGTTGTKCLTISRGYGQSSIEACNGGWYLMVEVSIISEI